MLSFLEKVPNITAALSSYEETHVMRVEISFRGLQTGIAPECVPEV